MEEEEANQERGDDASHAAIEVVPDLEMPEGRDEKSSEEREREVGNEVKEVTLDGATDGGLDEAVEGEELLGSVSHALGAIEELLDLGRPVEVEGRDEHEELEVAGQNFEVDCEDRARSGLVLEGASRVSEERLT